MSGEHQTMVFNADGLTSNEKLLLLAYTEYTDPHGYCWPGMTRLAAMTGMSESTIKRTRKVLESKSLLRHQRRASAAGDPTSNMYRINLDKLATMRAAPRTFDDNLMAALEFSDTPSEQQIVHPDPTPGHPDPTPGQSDRGVGSGWTHGGVTVTSYSESDPREDSSDPEADDGRTEPAAPEKEEKGIEPEAETVLGAVDISKLGPRPRQRRQLTEAVGAALGSGYSSTQLTGYLRSKTSEARTMKYLLGAVTPERLAEEISESTPRLGVLRPVCGQCEGRDGDDISARVIEGADGRLRKCPRCHPHAATAAAEPA